MENTLIQTLIIQGPTKNQKFKCKYCKKEKQFKHTKVFADYTGNICIECYEKEKPWGTQ